MQNNHQEIGEQKTHVVWPDRTRWALINADDDTKNRKVEKEIQAEQTVVDGGDNEILCLAEKKGT